MRIDKSITLLAMGGKPSKAAVAKRKAEIKRDAREHLQKPETRSHRKTARPRPPQGFCPCCGATLRAPLAALKAIRDAPATEGTTELAARVGVDRSTVRRMRSKVGKIAGKPG